MSFTIDTRDLERLRAAYGRFSDRRFNAGLATALTKTAVAVKASQIAEMRDVFDRPTPRTLGAVFVSAANANKLEARVGIAENPFSQGGSGRAPIKWLRWQIFGGPRTAKAFERRLISAGAMPDGMRAVPARMAARLDAFGNISAGQLRQIFSQLRIELSGGAKSTLPTLSAKQKRLLASAKRGSGMVGPIQRSALKEARASASRIKSAYTRAGGQYIALPNGRGKLRPGIYLTRDTAFGRTDPKPVLLYVTSANYEAGRYDFDYVSQLAVQRNMGREVDAAMADQLRRWASKYGAGA